LIFMTRTEIVDLLARYNAGVSTSEDQQQLEALLEGGVIGLEDIESLRPVQAALDELPDLTPSANVDDAFYQMLANEKRRVRPIATGGITWAWLWPRMAFTATVLVAGMTAGYFLRTPTAPVPTDQLAALSQEVTDLRETMMLTLLAKESAAERLKAVSLTQEMDQASQKVTQALLQTLNADGNVNVRLAALDALRPYAGQPSVREALIHAIALQDSPLVQVALAELMQSIQAKASVKELQKLLDSDKTPGDVKKKIEQTIQVLI
jgi:hypothetical protein